MAEGAWQDEALEAIRSGTARICIVGCGYVGLTLALEHARSGSSVVGIEVNEARAKDLRAGSNPVPDVAIPDGELARLRDSGNLTFVSALTEPADVYVICVNTPLRDGSPDLRFIESAGESVAKVLAAKTLVVLESTTYPGTTEELLRPLLEEASGLVAGEDFALAHSPERINPADTAWTMRNTPKVVGGLTPRSTELAAAFYSRVCDTVVPVSAPRTAEITKLFENTYREVNIALANEMSVVCHEFGIDPWEVVRAAGTKPYGFTAFKPGPGVGGECLLPNERLYVREGAEVRVQTAEALWATAQDADEALEIASLGDAPGDWNRLSAIGRREYTGEAVRITCRGGREVAVTAKHPMLLWRNERLEVISAGDVAEGDLVPVWRGHDRWEAILNPRIDLLRGATLPTDVNIGVRLTFGDWAPWRSAIKKILGQGATDEVMRRGRLPLHTFLELEQRGDIDVSHEDLMLWTGRGASARSFPAVVEITPELARLVGYYIAEGCITDKHAPRVVFAFHRHEVEAHEDVIKLCGSLGLSTSVRHDKKWKTTAIKVSSRLFAILLRDVLGCGVNSYDARVPSMVLGASSAHRYELLSGLLRGDGSVWTENKTRAYTKNGQRYVGTFRSAEVGYFSVNEALIREVEFVMLSLGFVPEFRRRWTQAGAELRIHGSQDLNMLASLFCDAKKRRLETYNATRKTAGRKSRAFTRKAGLHLVPVTGVTKLDYSGYVYSIETEPSHTLVMNGGIVVHNCIPVDPQYLAWRVRGKVGRQFHLLEAASDINRRMPAHVAQRASEILNEHEKAMRGANVLLLGVAYKGGSGDTRESPALRVADRLAAAGAKLTYHDAFVETASFGGVIHDSHPLTDDAVSSADLVVILTDHPNIDYAAIVAKARCVYDTRGVTTDLSAPPPKLYRA